MKPLHVFSLCLIIRLLSVFLVQTWFVADEYWQSLEVAHNYVFGYGYLTWEWIAGIRSYIYPLIIGFLYKILYLVGLDYTAALIYGPRVLQALLSAYSDFCFFNWSGGQKWSIFCITTSWFWFYIGSRTIINSLEVSLTTIALSRFPWPDKSNGNCNFEWLVILLCLIRPTSAIPWLPLCVYHLAISHKPGVLVIKNYLGIGSGLLALSIVVDSFAHGKFVVTSFEFLKANIFNDVGKFYGVNPWHWYLSTGLPTILGIHVVPFVLASVESIRHRSLYRNELALLNSICFTIFIYSLLAHKEFRFISSLLPMALKLSCNYLSKWSRKTNKYLVWLVAGIVLLGNVIPALYFSMVHQRGVLDVMAPLRKIAQENPHNTSILFLTPCHSTPFYSHLHVNVTMKFLTCEPNLSGPDADYLDEAAKFYNNSDAWLKDYFSLGNTTLPSHIVIFDHLKSLDILRRYRPISTIFHTHIVTDKRVTEFVVLYEKLQI